MRRLTMLLLLVSAAPLYGQEKAADTPVVLAGHRVELVAENARAGRYHDSARLTLTLRNDGEQTVSAWRAIMVVQDPFGDELFRIQLTDGRADIAPGGTSDATFGFDDNPFIDGEPYDKLAGYNADNLSIRLENLRIVWR